MASSNFPTMPMPPVGAQNLNYLSLQNISSEFTKSLRALVHTVTPTEMGMTLAYSEEDKLKLPEIYATKMTNYLNKKPYVLKELVGTQKFMYSDLSPSDKQWVKDKIIEVYKIERSSSDYKTFSSRIAPEDNYSWMEFRTVDCVFAAVIHELSPQTTMRIDSARLPNSLTDKAKEERVKQSEASEEALERWLAGYLNIPREVMQDTRLIYIMEQDLGFKNIPAVKVYGDIKKTEYRGKSFILSYERTPGTLARSGSWHTVHIVAGVSPVITDRQAAASGREPGIADTASCDVWEIRRDSPGFKKLIQAFQDRT